MNFIIGGRCCGKRDYVRKHFGLEPKSAFDNDFSGAVCDVPLYVRDIIKNGGDTKSFFDNIIKSKTEVVISEEVGCGIVPADEFERRYRDSMGNINRQLAEYADSVIRVVCGIGVKLK